MTEQISGNGEQTLTFIQHRTAHIIRKQQQATAMLLNQSDRSANSRQAAPPTDPTLAEIEEHIRYWDFLIPAEPDARASLARAFAERYGFTPADAPRVAQALDLPVDASAARAVAPPAPTSDAIQDVLFHELEWLYVKRGETLFRQGEEDKHLYIVVDGLIHLLRQDGGGAETLEGSVSSGQFLGAAPLFADQVHFITARAVRDSDICRLSREALERVITQHPQVLMQVVGQLAEWLRPGARPMSNGRTATVAVIVPTDGVDVDDFMARLTAGLQQYGETLCMKPDEMETEIRARTGATLEHYVDAYDFVDWLQEQAAHYHFVLYQADPDYPHWTRRGVEQADRILIVGRAGASPHESATEQIVRQMPHPELLPACELVLLHESRNHNPGDTRAWLAKRTIRRHHHVALDTGEGIDRVSRFLRGKAIGVVLGGGGMRAAACAGVLRALEELNIQADVVGGTSAGSIAAAQYAMGWDTETITHVTAEKLMKRNVWVQPTLPLVSVTTAKRLSQTYMEIFGDAYIEDQWISPFTISGNLTRAHMVVHRSGLLYHAVRASTSLAGIHPPTLNEDGDLLIDGGIFNNTPADVAREMVDTGPVIAVDLGFTVRQRIKFDYGEWLNGFKVMWSRINPFSKGIATPSIVGIMMRANALGSINSTAEQVSHADLILRPPVSDYGLFDFDAYRTIAQTGYEYGMEQITAWLDAGGMDGV